MLARASKLEARRKTHAFKNPKQPFSPTDRGRWKSMRIVTSKPTAAQKKAAAAARKAPGSNTMKKPTARMVDSTNGAQRTNTADSTGGGADGGADGGDDGGNADGADTDAMEVTPPAKKGAKMTQKKVDKIIAEYPFADYSSEKDEWICTHCASAEADVPFSKGLFIPSNKVKQRLLKHEGTATHKRAVASVAAKEAIACGDETTVAPGVGKVKSMSKLARAALEQKRKSQRPGMRLAAQLGAMGRPATDFGPLLTVVEESANDLGANVTLESSHRDNKSARGMFESLRAELDLELLDELRASPTLAVMIDESTDVSTTEMMVVYFAYIKMTTHEPAAALFAVPRMKGTSAEEIKKKLEETVKRGGDLTLWRKLMHIGFDGASVMTGHGKGVGKLMRDDIPALLQHHCVSV